MASTPTDPDAAAGYLSDADEDRYQAAVDPSNPYTSYGNTTPLKRPSPSSSPSAFPPSQAPPVAVDHRLLSRGFRVLQLPSGSNNLEPPAEAFNHGRQIFQDDLPRRSLIPSPAVGSCAAAQILPPSFPSRRLARSASDPVPMSQFQNPLLSTQEKNSGPNFVVGSRTDPNSPSGSLGNVSGLSPAQELPSPKRLKRLDQIQRIKQMKQLLDEMVKDDEQDDGLTNISTGKAIMEGEAEAEEDVVSAKKDGDSTHLKFKCSCGSGFDVVIIGQCCYYKLI